MPNYTVTIDVADLTPNGAAPRLGFATISRARIDATTSEIITEAAISIRLTDAPQTLQLEQNAAYRVQLAGVIGLPSTFYVRHNADATLADLYLSHQVDPATLQPAPIPPSTQDLLDQANTVLEQVLAVGFTVTGDPDDADALLIGYPASMVDPDDPDAILFTTGA